MTERSEEHKPHSIKSRAAKATNQTARASSRVQIFEDPPSSNDFWTEIKEPGQRGAFRKDGGCPVSLPANKDLSYSSTDISAS